MKMMHGPINIRFTSGYLECGKKVKGADDVYHFGLRVYWNRKKNRYLGSKTYTGYSSVETISLKV